MLKKVIVTLVLLCSCVMLVPAYDSKAYEYKDFSILSDRPVADEYSGYIEIYGTRNSDGYEMVRVIKWYCQNSEGYGQPFVNMYINSNGNMSLAAQVTEHFSVFYISSDGMDTWERIYDGNLGPNAFYPDVMSGYTIKAYRIYGNVASATDNLVGYNSNGFIVKYNVENVIVDEQKESNTWLEKIFDAINGNSEQEKQEAQIQGNSSVSQGNSAIEDKGGDFAGSLSGLTNSMSYTGTQCSWEFPQVKLPAISGVMDEMILIKKQPIDFAVWVNAIPSDILLVVQSLCTAGLIIYCFKELYDTIAYVLTLRKDDNS